MRARRWRAVGLTSWLLSLSLSSSVHAQGAYEVYEAVGEIHVWSELGSQWRRVAPGALVGEGDLVQMAAGSRLSVRGRRMPDNPRVAAGMKLSADEPLLTRIAPKALRQVELSGYFLTIDTGDEKGKGKSKPDATEMADVESAWARALNFFSPSGVKPRSEVAGNQLAARTGPGAEARQPDDAEMLKIKYPQHGSTVLLPSLPDEIGVTWDAASTSASTFVVYLWREDSGRPQRAATTQEGFVRLKIRTSGRYLVRVESTDGGWRSPAHLFVVEELK